MKKLLIVVAVAFTACNSPEKKQQPAKHDHEKETAVSTIPLNEGRKWKADEPTRQNVAALQQVINESRYTDAANRKELSASLQAQIDNMVKQCKMKGPEHDALHVWLQQVLNDMKALKAEEEPYPEVYAALKKDIGAFHTYFE